jgi:hypothetical protein
MSPIRTGGGGELTYVIREAAAVVAHLWQTRVDPIVGSAMTPLTSVSFPVSIR